MEKIGEYEYPTLGTFKNALDIASIGVNKYGDITPNFAAARVLGYNVPENKTSLSGVIYRRFDELSLFGLFTRDRGGLRVTDLGKEALDPYDTSKADAAKAKAIGKFPIIIKAFDVLQGQLPDSTALPGKLSAITNANWTEIKKHTENLKKLFSSAFPYLKPSGQFSTAPLVSENMDRRDMNISNQTQQLIRNEPIGRISSLGEVRTKIGSVVLTNKSTIRLAIKHLEVLLEQLEEEETKEQKSEIERDNNRIADVDKDADAAVIAMEE